MKNDKPESKLPEAVASRRDALKKLGLMTGVAVAGTLASTIARADDIDTAPPDDLRVLVRRSNRLPHTASIKDLRITAEHAGQLTPGAQKLTKADLLALAEAEAGVAVVLSAAAKALTPADIKSIKTVFNRHNQDVTAATGGHPKLLDTIKTSCCCCTPCCCAAAVVEPQRSVA